MQSGNNRLIDGWQIRVKEASYGWNERFRPVKKSNCYTSFKTFREENGQKDPYIYRERRSYKDVVLGYFRDGVGFEDRGEVSSQEAIAETKRMSFPREVRRERFDFAKILILVDNKEDISSYVNVKFNGELIKINVSVKDSSSAIVNDKRLEGMFDKEGKDEAARLYQGNVNSRVGEKLVSNHEANRDPNIGKANEVNAKGPYATLSATEQIGVSEDFEVVNNVGQVNKQKTLLEVEENSQDINFDIVVGEDFGNNMGLLEAHVVGDTDLGSYEGTIVPLSIGEPSLNRTLPSGRKGKKIGEVYNKGVASGTRGKGRRKFQKEMQNIIREDENLNVDCSDFSISDDDIAHRNTIIRKKVEATWDICTMLGVVFDKDKNQMIDIFQ
ncbi:hypothetical protein DITRI_Ditri15bG0041300 [Diplodiscus trichospermus]